MISKSYKFKSKYPKIKLFNSYSFYFCFINKIKYNMTNNKIKIMDKRYTYLYKCFKFYQLKEIKLSYLLK